MGRGPLIRSYAIANGRDLGAEAWRDGVIMPPGRPVSPLTEFSDPGWDFPSPTERDSPFEPPIFYISDPEYLDFMYDERRSH